MKPQQEVKTNPNLKRVNAILSLDLYRQLLYHSAMYGGSMSFYIRKALEQYFKEVKGKYGKHR